MARMAHGERLSATKESVTYRFAENPRDKWDGVLVIPVAEPDTAHVEDMTDPPFAARAVFGKAFRHYEVHGDWPESVLYAS